MEFDSIRIKDIDFVVRYKSQAHKWTSKNRTNHFVGIQLYGKSYHDFGYQRFTLEEKCIYFFNQRDDYSVEEITDTSESFSVHFTTYGEVETPTFYKKINNEGEVVRWLEQIERLTALSGRGDNLAMSYLYRLCDYIGSLYRQPYTPADRRILEAREYMDLH